MRRAGPTAALTALALSACAATPPPPPAASVDTTPAAPLPGGCSIPLGAELYPVDARRRGASGVVTVSFRLDAKGEPEQVALLSGAGGYFDAAARQVLKESHCPAAAAADGAVPHYVIDIQFVLLPCRTPENSAHASAVVTICATRKR